MKLKKALIGTWVAIAILLQPVSSFAQTDVLYDNAEGSPITQLINKAKSTIDIEIYEMENLNVITALSKAVQRGVKVRVVQEANPYQGDCFVFTPATTKDSANCVAQKNFVSYVKQNKGEYVPFNIKQLCAADAKFCYQHGKILIADGAVAILSTGNYNDSSFCDFTRNADRCNRDYTILTRDPQVVKTLELIFQKDLEGKAYDLARILSTSAAARLTVSPYSLDPIIRFINSAKASIVLQNQYLNDFTVNRALIDAAKRGVKVFVNVTSVCYFQRPDQYNIDRWTKTFTLFDEAGIQSKMFTQKMKINHLPGYLHAKAILVDGTKLWVGSTNGSTQSIAVNREFGLFTNEPAAISKFSQKFNADFKNTYAVDWKESLACKNDSPSR